MSVSVYLRTKVVTEPITALAEPWLTSHFTGKVGDVRPKFFIKDHRTKLDKEMRNNDTLSLRFLTVSSGYSHFEYTANDEEAFSITVQAQYGYFLLSSDTMATVLEKNPKPPRNARFMKLTMGDPTQLSEIFGYLSYAAERGFHGRDVVYASFSVGC